MLQRAIRATQKAGGEVVEVSREVLEKIARRDNPQAVLGVFPQRFADIATLQPSSCDLLGGAAGGARSRATWGPSCAPPTPRDAAG